MPSIDISSKLLPLQPIAYWSFRPTMLSLNYPWLPVTCRPVRDHYVILIHLRIKQQHIGYSSPLYIIKKVQSLYLVYTFGCLSLES